MIEKILIDLNVPENKWYLYSLDENDGLVSPTPDVLFNEGFITEDDFLYQEWIKNKDLANKPTEIEIVALAIVELDAQREKDKLESQIAIAELAEAIGGK